MPRIRVAQLRLGMTLTKQLFLLRDKRVTTTRAGSLMLHVTLADRSGAVAGVYFDVPAHVPDSLVTAKGVEVTGRVAEFKGQLQVNIDRIAPARLLDAEDFLPSATRPLEEMTKELDALLASIQDPHLSGLLSSIFGDAQTHEAFCRAPAAKHYHHACVGGLLEHSLAVARLALVACELYPQLDRDLVLTLAILHDLGKLQTYDPISFQKTNQGSLWAHVYVSASLVERHVDELPDFPTELRLRVVHAILAHHGRLENGSPVLPMTLEAIVLHGADKLDADARGAIDHVARAHEDSSSFTEHSFMHETKLYRGAKESPGAAPGEQAELW